MDRRPPPPSTLPTRRPSITSSLARPPSAVPAATPSSRIPFGSKRPLPSSSTLDEPPSALRRTNTSTALQVDLERKLGLSDQKVRELERQVEEGKREVEDVRNMMRLLVADEEGREREHGQARENLQQDLAKSQEEIRSLRLQVSTTLSESASLSSTLSQTELQLSRKASDFELQLSALMQQIQASDEDAQLAREKGDRWKAEVESLRRRVGDLGEQAEGRKRRGEENESAQELREELKRQSSLLSSQAGQLTSLTAELTTLRSKRSDQSNRVSTLELEVEQWSTRCRELEEASSAGDEQGSKEQERVVSELKSGLEDKSRKIDQLEKDLASSSTLGAQHTSLLTQHADLKSALTSLQAAHDLLERRVARGEYNPETFQCLQLALNPSTMDLAVRTATLEGLKRENEALLKAGTGEVPRETYERVLKEREEERLQMEKRLQRLKEVFKAKSQEFLDTLYSLLGYRVLFSEAGDVKLNTTYAPRGKSGVTFKFAPSASAEEGEKSNFGSMSIQGSLGKTLDELREFWVTQRQEVPCFLASVQLELYDRSTRGKAAGWVRPMDEDD